MKDPLALFALCFAAGVLLAGYIEPGLVTLFIIAIPSIYFAYKLHHRGALKASTWLLSTAFLISGLAIAIYEENLYQSREIVSLFRSHRLTSDDTVGLTGVIDSRPEQSPDGYFLTLKLERMRFKGEFSASGKVRLFTPLKNLQSRREFDRLCLIRGTSIDVLVKLNREERHRNPGSNSFLKFLRNKGLDATGTIKSPLLIEPFGQTRQFVLSLWLDDLHHRLLNRIDELFSNPLSGLLKAFLLGNRHYIDRETADRFREGGTLHVIVISGMHISFIAGALILLFRFTGSRRLTQVLGTSLLVTLYTLLVGAEVSIVRASLMFLITSTGYLLFRPIRALNLIGAAVLLILTLSPYTLFDPSFQLTFLSVSLVALSLRVLKRMKETGSWFPSEHMPHPPMSPAWLTVLCETFFWRQKVWRKETSKLSYSYRLYKSPLAERLERYHVQWLLRGLFISLMVTFVVQLGLLPLSVLYFHRFSYASFLLNLFVGMLLGVVSIISLVVLSLSLFTKETGFFIDVAEFLSSVAIHSVDPLKREQIASIRLAEYSAGGGVIYLVYFLTILYIGYLLWTWDPFSRSYRPKRTLIIIFSLTLLLIFYPIRFEEPGRVRVDFLDVGQGDSVLITAPDSRTILVDGGGSSFSTSRDTPGVGEAAVSEYLWWRGIGRLDLIIATHGHADHIQGLRTVVENFDTGAALLHSSILKTTEGDALGRIFREKRVPVIQIMNGDRFNMSGMDAEIIWPPADDLLNLSENDRSVVLGLSYGRRRILLTGDIEATAEKLIEDRLKDFDLVKVPHHGSLSSSTINFVEKTDAEYAVISVAKRSQFGHPHKEVVRRWKGSGATVLSTADHGLVSVSTDGFDLRITGYLSGVIRNR